MRQEKGGSLLQHCHDCGYVLQAIERLEGLLKLGQTNAAARPPISPTRRTSSAAAVAPAAADHVDSIGSSSSVATEGPAANSSHAGRQDAQIPAAASQADAGRSSYQVSAANDHSKHPSELSAHGPGSLGQSKPSLAGGQDALQNACDRLNAEDAASAGASPRPAEHHFPASSPQQGNAHVEASQMSRLEQMLAQQGQQMAALESAVHRLKPPEHGSIPDASKDHFTTPDGMRWWKEETVEKMGLLTLASIALCGTMLVCSLYRRT